MMRSGRFYLQYRLPKWRGPLPSSCTQANSRTDETSKSSIAYNAEKHSIIENMHTSTPSSTNRQEVQFKNMTTEAPYQSETNSVHLYGNPNRETIPDNTPMIIEDHHGLEILPSAHQSCPHFSDMTHSMHETMREVVQQNLARLGFHSPTPVQSIAFPLLRDGKNTVVCAPTASGKTLLFAMFALQRVSVNTRWQERVSSTLDPTQDRPLEVDSSRSEIQCRRCGLHMGRVKICPETGRLHPAVSNHESERRSMDEYEVSEPLIVLIMPSRELVLQVRRTIRELTSFTSHSVDDQAGGAAKNSSPRRSSLVRLGWLYGKPDDDEAMAQRRSIRGAVDIVVASPTRLYKCIAKKELATRSVVAYVVDEADNLAQIGFTDSIEPILVRARSGNIQRIMICATLPDPALRVLAGYMGKSFVRVRPRFWPEKYALRSVSGVTHRIHMCAPTQRTNVLLNILRADSDHGPKNKALIFCNSSRTAAWLATEMRAMLHNTTYERIACLHSRRTHEARSHAMRSFDAGSSTILITTTVAARGVDFKDVTCVFNFDIPHTIEEYIHRSGRTGRHGRMDCWVHSTFIPEDAPLARDLVRYIQFANPRVATGTVSTQLPPKLLEYAHETFSKRLARDLKVVAPGRRTLKDRMRLKHRVEKPPMGREVAIYGQPPLEGSKRAVERRKHFDIRHGVNHYASPKSLRPYKKKPPRIDPKS